VESSYTDYQYFTVNNSGTESQPAYGLFNLRAGWNAPNHRYQIEAYVENLANKRYFQFASNVTPDTLAATWGAPRTAGVKFSVHY
jgi:outer membrane receptor protein involved in Fe transport